ncbi:MAG: ABC transporter permease [Bdellovibrionales bacterium]|nr:ABC transporter permease [Bdellovibrionales bacterium]
MYQLWLVWRFLRSGQKFLNFTTLLSMFGMIIGVASLVVAMAVVSGFETTLKNSVIDSVGHVLVMKRGSPLENSDAFLEEIHKVSSHIRHETPFVYLEAVVAHNKKVSGVVVQGVDPASYQSVLRLHHRLKEGEFEFGAREDGVDGALIGRGLAETFKLAIGESFKVVMPVASEYDNSSIRPRLKKFFVRGILDLGRYDWNQRFVLTDLSAAQDFAGIGSQVMGFRLRLDKDEHAKEVTMALSQKLGHDYWMRNWEDVNQNLFEAVKLEKLVIFFVLLIMVIAACFNISSTLFVSVLRRYADLSVLKTLGATKGFLTKLFTIQGLLIGGMGALLGMIVGMGLCYAFLFAQQRWGLLPGEVYKLERVDIEFRATDMGAILLASLLICYISTRAPARRGADMSPVEGLRYD